MLTMLIPFAMVSCQKEVVNDETHDIIFTNDRLLNEVSSLIPNASADVAFDFISLIQHNADEFETIYPSFVFSPETKGSSAFISTIIDEVSKNPLQYPILSNVCLGTKSGVDDYWSELPVEFYFPNSKSFDVDAEEYLTIAYPSKETEEWTDGYKYDRMGNKMYVPYIDESYLEYNMTLIILPKDTTDYVKPLTEEEIQLYLAKQSGITTKADLPNGKISSNITNSSDIAEEDILVTTVAAIRVHGTSWCGSISNKLKLAIYRASGDVVFNADGSLKPSGTCYKPFVIPISKDNLKANAWIEGYYIFDDDWDLHEYDQTLYFVSEHNTGKKSADLTASVGIGYKDNKPSVEMSVKADVNVSFENHSTMRQYNQFTRVSRLANITTDLGSGTYKGYTIYSHGIVDLVFNHYYTDIQSND
mgnify:CR=1 FL=1